MTHTVTDAPPRSPARSHPGLIGAFAGVVGIGCCLYPIVLVLLGLSTAAAAVDLGKTLFRDRGWAFKLAGLGLIAVAVAIQRRRSRSCPPDAPPRVARDLVTMAVVAVVTYAALYTTTTWLGNAAI